MIRLLLLRFILILAGFPILLFLHACKPSTKTQLESWSSKATQDQAIHMDELARIVFDHSYRSTEWKDNGQLFIEYGGSSALTFSDSKTYVPMIQLDLARKAYRAYIYGKSRGLKSLRVSLVKPLYVKDAPQEDLELQEFEIYRIRIDENSLIKIQDQWEPKDFPNSFLTNDDDMPQGELLEFLDLWQKNWIVELNQFSRIEVN